MRERAKRASAQNHHTLSFLRNPRLSQVIILLVTLLYLQFNASAFDIIAWKFINDSLTDKLLTKDQYFDKRSMFEICLVFGPWGPSPWVPMGATHTIWRTLNPLPVRMIPAKFGYNPTMRFQEEDENVKSLRTTHDGQKRTEIAHFEPSAQVS